MQTFVSDWETHLPNRSNLHEATDVCVVYSRCRIGREEWSLGLACSAGTRVLSLWLMKLGFIVVFLE